MRESGGNVVGCPALFSSDNDAAILFSEGLMKVYGSETGRAKKVFPLAQGKVCGAVLDPSRPNTHILAITGSGEVLKISLADGDCQVGWKADRGLKAIVGSGSNVFALSTDGIKVYQMVSSDGKVRIFPVIKSREAIQMLACNQEYLAYAAGKKAWVWSCQEDPNRKAIESVEFEHQVTCLNWSGESDLVIGHLHGGMTVIRGISHGNLAKCLQEQSQQLHWHSNAVTCMAGSPSDFHLVSGGQEAVGVLWDLGRGSSGSKKSAQFLPRLGAPILHAAVSHDGSKWAFSLADNAVAIVSSASFSLLAMIRGLAPVSTPCVQPYQKGTAQLILPAGEHSLQVFDPLKDRHVATLHVTMENLVAGLPEHKKRPDNRQVKMFTQHGKLLATVDSRKSASSGCLRIWKFDNENLTYEQAAVFDEPHGPRAKVTAMTFRTGADGEPELLTGDSNGYLKLWRETKTVWSGTAKEHVGHHPIKSIDYSADGSLLVLACGPSVLLARGADLRFVRALTCGTTSVTHAALLEGNLLVAYDQDSLFVWNLLTLQLSWSLDVQVTAFTLKDAGSFAIACKDRSGTGSHVVLFNGASSIPVGSHKHEGRLICGLAMVERVSDSILMALTSESTFITALPSETRIEIDSQVDTAPDAVAKEIMRAAAERAAERLVAPPAPVINWDLPCAKTADLLLEAVPTHVLPSMRLLLASYMKRRLPPK